MGIDSPILSILFKLSKHFVLCVISPPLTHWEIMPPRLCHDGRAFLGQFGHELMNPLGGSFGIRGETFH